MRVLTISPYPVLPQLHGGRVRTLKLAAGMARAGAQVAVLCPWHPKQPRRALLEEGLELHTHRLATNALLAFSPHTVASPLALLSLQPRGAWGTRQLLRSFASFDVVQLEFCAQAPWLEMLNGNTKTIYSAHNVELDFFAAAAARYRLRRWSLTRLEQLERLAVRESDLVVTCNEHDAARLAALYGQPARTAVVQNGFDGSLLEFDRQALREEARTALGFAPHERVMLFLGGNAWHNREALDFFVRDLLPTLDADMRLLVVGTAGRHLAGAGERVLAVGFVEDLRPHLAAADVALNPVSSDCGSSVKLVDYIAAGVPVISTPAGARGFGRLPGVRVVPREAFALALREPPPDVAPHRSALSALTWDALGRRLLGEYERLV